MKKPVHTCVCVCACGWREGGMVHSSVFLAPRHSESTCLNSMWSPGPAHCSQTLPLVFAMLAAECPHAVLSADTLSQLVNMFCRGNSQGKQL